jgi:molybdenum-dependent DNA-binding transcriptional regulator ModE
VEVGEHLVKNYSVRKDAVTKILDDYRDELRAAFNGHDSAKESAKAVNDKIQKHV